MKIVHLADSHLGASGRSQKLTPEGWNQREEDFLHVFDIAIQKAIELKPDIVIHAGDLFHVVRPTNRVIARAARALLKLSEAQIPTIVIGGNHDTPKSRSIGSVFQIMDIIPDINYVYKGIYEKFPIGDALIHAVPHCLSQDDFDTHLAQVNPDSTFKYNILVLHGVVSSIPEFSMNEFAEQFLPDSLFLGFDYVALGHYHKFTKVANNCFYAGSSERLSFNEEGQDKGLLEVDFPGPAVKFHLLPAREMFKIKLDAKEMDSEILRESIKSTIEREEIKDSISRLEIINLPSHLIQEIPKQEISKMTSDALNFDIKVSKSEDETALTEQSIVIGKLESEFQDFLKRTVVESGDKEALLNLGAEYLRRVKED
ncbi:MAG: exonuclease SbcCD subunit D [candidate division Zixibacteria bacterium]|nr:exonuclease SbcCD subunit D [candidate division Zixibacteria bacterium]